MGTSIKKVDYAKIAKRYDANRRQLSERDADLEQFLNLRTQSHYAILDIGCGTGNHFEKQTASFKDRPIAWFGLEPSEAMMRIAREKVPNASFTRGTAEALPYTANTFDFIVTTFAFHHFSDKAAAIGEMVRVLAPGGMLKYVNIEPERMPAWIYYTYFPATYREDLARYWNAAQLKAALEHRGLNVTLNTDMRTFEWKLSEALMRFKNRDASQLWLISENEYQEGMAAVEQDLAQNPEAAYRDEMAFTTCIAQKP